jgi:hypothetical protein
MLQVLCCNTDTSYVVLELLFYSMFISFHRRKIKKLIMSIIFFVNVWRKNIFDIYVTEYGTALTTILPILFLYLNTHKQSE